MSNLFSQFIILMNRAFMKNLMLILLFFLVSVRSMAQITDNKSHTYEAEVTGNVSDNNGFPLTGVSLIVKGTTNGTTSNFDGNFSLDVEDGVIIIISYAGFKTKEITVENWIKMNITLEEEVKSETIRALTKSEIRKKRRADNMVRRQAQSRQAQRRQAQSGKNVEPLEEWLLKAAGRSVKGAIRKNRNN